MNTNTSINELMHRPLWQMTGEEFCALTRFATSDISLTQAPIHQAIGIQALARELGCSASLLYGIKRTGCLRKAILSRIGKKEVFDVELARSLANDYQTQIRKDRREQR